MTGTTPGARLRTLLTADRPLLLPGAYDALSGRVLADLDFEAVYATGAGLANAAYGWPDVGLIGMSEVVSHVRRLADVVDVPLVVDIDTGYGGPLNIARTVTELERAGAAALQIEDQVAPKRCGHFAGTDVVDVDEMLGRLRAALNARQDPSTVIIARTDATASLGLDAAIVRGQLLADAGADVVFVEAPRSVDDLGRIPAEVPAPTLVNVVEGGRTPQLDLAEYASMGFDVVLYANSALRLAAQAVTDGMGELLRAGTTAQLGDRLLTWDARQALVRKEEFDRLAEHLVQDSSSAAPDGRDTTQEVRTA